MNRLQQGAAFLTLAVAGACVSAEPDPFAGLEPLPASDPVSPAEPAEPVPAPDPAQPLAALAMPNRFQLPQGWSLNLQNVAPAPSSPFLSDELLGGDFDLSKLAPPPKRGFQPHGENIARDVIFQIARGLAGK